MTDPRNTRVPQFFLTPGGPCPYLPGKVERKVFARLTGPLAQPLSEALTHSGFRRSQSIAYRPACEGCNACVSVRIVVQDFAPSRSQKRIARRDADLARAAAPAEATREQFALLRTYLDSRHSGGGMSDMGLFDYVAMVEETPVSTYLVEYRRRSLDPLDSRDPLIATCLSDVLDDGVSMIYSFYDPKAADRSLGTFMILSHIEWALKLGLPYVYLGYWIAGSEKMAYKAKFQPLEMYADDAWRKMKI